MPRFQLLRERFLSQNTTHQHIEQQAPIVDKDGSAIDVDERYLFSLTFNLLF